MRTRNASRLLRPCVAVLAALAASGTSFAAKKYTTEFSIERCTFASQDAGNAGNPFFPLVPGSQIVLEEDEGAVRVEITTENETESITFTSDDDVVIHVDARVVEEREFEDGELVEVSRNFFARCVETGDIFYFGEEVDPPEGSWRAGEDGAQPGVIMPGTFLIGSRYFQEQAPDVAMDRAEHVKMDLEVETLAGDFEDCVLVKETTALDGGSSAKQYCPGVGLVNDDGAVLIEIHAP
jgi:hypothetical protein